MLLSKSVKSNNSGCQDIFSPLLNRFSQPQSTQGGIFCACFRLGFVSSPRVLMATRVPDATLPLRLDGPLLAAVQGHRSPGALGYLKALPKGLWVLLFTEGAAMGPGVVKTRKNRVFLCSVMSGWCLFKGSLCEWFQRETKVQATSVLWGGGSFLERGNDSQPAQQRHVQSNGCQEKTKLAAEDPGLGGGRARKRTLVFGIGPNQPSPPLHPPPLKQSMPDDLNSGLGMGLRNFHHGPFWETNRFKPVHESYLRSSIAKKTTKYLFADFKGESFKQWCAPYFYRGSRASCTFTCEKKAREDRPRAIPG